MVTKTTKDQAQTMTAPAKMGNNPPERPAIAGSAVLIGEVGTTTIYPQVVAKIAGLAVREVEGVHDLVPFGAGQQVTSLAKSIVGGEMKDLGVRVEVGAKEAAIDVRIISDYGASIPAISEAIRRNAADRIGTMTGLKVVEINIDVMDLYFPGDEVEEKEKEETRRVV